MTLNGAPVSGARVIFTDGKDAGASAAGPAAVTDDTGEYAVVGVPPGAYKVVVYKLVPAKGATLPDMNDLEQLEASGMGTHALPKKYSRAASTTLTAQVDSGANSADLKLTSPEFSRAVRPSCRPVTSSAPACTGPNPSSSRRAGRSSGRSPTTSARSRPSVPSERRAASTT
ncbi:MAG: carboxypeptidase regulatory-like domain-containing protein [Planctomycetes bacterium]|nr:carboxypeptidase regulatory-like domain-containing protein [Planctomycetota bacterium]